MGFGIACMLMSVAYNEPSEDGAEDNSASLYSGSAASSPGIVIVQLS